MKAVVHAADTARAAGLGWWIPLPWTAEPGHPLPVLREGRVAAVGVAPLLSASSALSEFSADTSVFGKYQETSQRRQRVAVSEC